MKQSLVLLSLSCLILVGCRSDQVKYSQALFEHVPEDPDLLVLVKPEDIISATANAIQKVDLNQFLGETFQVDPKQIETYKNMSLKIMEELGIPYENVESIGVMFYLERPVLLITGDFLAETVRGKMGELGFKQYDTGYWEYIYSGFQMDIPTDGLMVLADQEMLADLNDIPAENRLWNREDFKHYRETSPLDNSIFVWSHPPEEMLSGFKYRDVLGDVSMAINVKNNLSLRATVRITDPEKAVLLYNMIFGSVSVAKGFLGDDPDLGPIANAVTVSQDTREVVTSLVVTEEQFDALIKRIESEAAGGEGTSLEKISSFMKAFQ